MIFGCGGKSPNEKSQKTRQVSPPSPRFWVVSRLPSAWSLWSCQNANSPRLSICGASVVSETGMKNGDFPMQNGDFPMKNGDFPMKNCDFPMENCDFSMKNCDFPMKNKPFIVDLSVKSGDLALSK